VVDSAEDEKFEEERELVKPERNKFIWQEGELQIVDFAQ
jgi:hypothetical protein